MARPTATEIRLVSVYVATGSTKEAAAALGIHPDTYRHRLGRVYRRHEVQCMAQLVYVLRAELPDTTDGVLSGEPTCPDD